MSEHEKAIQLLRDIVAQWEGAEWCDDAVKFLQTYQPDESAKWWKCAKCNAENVECDECGGTGRADCAQIELRSRLNDAAKHGTGLAVKLTKDYAITPGLVERIEGANVSAATRSDSVVADGVTLPEGEKPAPVKLLSEHKERADYLRGQICRIWSMTGDRQHEIWKACSEALEHDDAILKAQEKSA
jgi:hypothetical protein